MYKEYREMSRTEAVDALYQDMAARHRARFRSVHVSCCYLDVYLRTATDPFAKVLKVVEVEKNRGCQAPIHEAAPHQGTQVPTAPPYRQEVHQKPFRCSPTFDVCIGVTVDGARDKKAGGFERKAALLVCIARRLSCV